MGARFLTVCCLAVTIIAVKGLAFAEHTVTPSEVVNRTDKAKYTSLEIKKFVHSLKGQHFSAAGTIHDVKEGHTGYKVVINAGVPGRSRHFVVDVFMKKGGKFHKGGQVACSGKVTRFNRFTYNGIGIDGSCR